MIQPRLLLVSLLTIRILGFCPIDSSPAWFASRLSSTIAGASPDLVSQQFLVDASANTVSFTKYHGLGNDFILIDNRDRKTPSLTSVQAEQLCRRNFGVGADGVIFALAPSSENYDFAMRIYNSDGSEPEMCGNGIRCMAKFLNDLGETQDSYTIETRAGPIRPVRNDDDGTITVDMGPPILDASKVPTTLEPNAEGNSVVEQTIEANGKTWLVNAVSMGNPHVIVFVNQLSDIDLATDGPALETHVAFPAKANIEFVQVTGPQHLTMQVWERGAGPTLACGTGACALTVAAIRAKQIDRKPTRVTLPGGDLWIEWKENDNKVYMTGPAEYAFHGTARL